MLRNQLRQGLIRYARAWLSPPMLSALTPSIPRRSRLLAANVVTSSVIAFLDAHLEVAEGWLEPLLFRLATRGRNMVVMPMVDILNSATDTLTPASAIMRYAF